jgi:hypothetical protein
MPLALNAFYVSPVAGIMQPLEQRIRQDAPWFGAVAALTSFKRMTRLLRGCRPLRKSLRLCNASTPSASTGDSFADD